MNKRSYIKSATTATTTNNDTSAANIYGRNGPPVVAVSSPSSSKYVTSNVFDYDTLPRPIRESLLCQVIYI